MEPAQKQVVLGSETRFADPGSGQTPPFATGRRGLEASRVLSGLAKNLLPYVVKGAAILNG